ncbi:MAG TPA: hypothetical protein VIK55_06640 [Paludibacter sp.]
MLLDETLSTGLTPEQIQAIETAYTGKETELKALANKNADGIFNGAAQKMFEQTGIQKNEGEKYSDYFIRLGSEWLPAQAQTKLTAAEEKVRLAEEKFANHKGDETLKAELEKAKTELAKIPDLLNQKETEWKTKHETVVNDFKAFKFGQSIQNAMPKFDETVNQFELKAKQGNAIDRIKKTYELSYDENDNLIGTKDYQKYLISDLLKSDEELKDLILIDQATGGGAGSGKKGATNGMFNFAENMSVSARLELIKQSIITIENIPFLDPRFPDRFNELRKLNKVL